MWLSDFVQTIWPNHFSGLFQAFVVKISSLTHLESKGVLSYHVMLKPQDDQMVRI